MRERVERSKWAFWLFVSVLAALVAVPSAVLLHVARAYYRFLAGAAPGVIRPTKAAFLDRRGACGPVADQDLRFVEFRLSAAKARRVELVGDFNGWKAGTLPMSRSGGANWEVMLPLPPGRYRYLFLVDGQARPDPRAPSETGADAKKTSVRAVP